eukprot:scaffold68172_cov63-Phaeocystis_antarctica.AAC.2
MLAVRSSVYARNALRSTVDPLRPGGGEFWAWAAMLAVRSSVYARSSLRSTVDCLRPEPVRPVSSSAVWEPPSDSKLSPSLSEDSRLVQDGAGME